MEKKFSGEVWERGLNARVADIRSSDLSSFMAKHGYMKVGASNTLSAYVKQLFDLVVADRVVAKSPFEGALTAKEPLI